MGRGHRSALRVQEAFDRSRILWSSCCVLFAPSRRRGQESLLQRPHSHLRAAIEIELSQQPLDVGLDRPSSYDETFGDLPVTQTPGDEHCDLEFAARQA